jgi:hypothetical protein
MRHQIRTRRNHSEVVVQLTVVTRICSIASRNQTREQETFDSRAAENIIFAAALAGRTIKL